ncbi:MAG TPA: LLM class flavin-dependent oxidoreductase [Acidimicrobiales bacterium]|nr:LLM class flavin-dependent oxidoreductase [Acidimicrobiales bacterium]
MPLDVALSVLDLAPVGEGSSPAEALRHSIELAQHVERLGYVRYWVAEHHNMPGIASSSPPVLLAAVGQNTSTIRLGSGGVMLPNHSPLVVAEQFGMLVALHPNRIDLGLGRAPGTDQVTALALRRTRERIMVDDFDSQLGELLGYFNGSIPDEHPFSQITATPGLGYAPDIWLLGSSDYGARLAGRLGMPYSYAHHFSSGGTDDAIAVYREEFRPSERLDKPLLSLGVAVICAETDERAQYLAGPGRLAMVRLRSGRPGRYPTPEEAAAYSFTPMEKEIAKGIGRSSIVGGVDTVRRGLQELLDRTGADELMLTTMTHGHDDRMESYRLVAEEVWRG